jgi:Cu(I)/Ag(I) efflux system membrane fusion protein
MKMRIIVAAVLGLLAGLFVGRGCGSHPDRGGGPEAAIVPAVSRAEIWTCSMHPQIRQPKPGQCPICFMDLIPAASHGSGTDTGTREIELSAAARKLAEVETAPVERRSVAVEIRLAGKVQMDETRVATITPRVAGRIDRLYANYTGMAVKPGEPLADLYSPELVSAQQELLQAAKLPGGAAGALAAATRERLRLWGLTAAQIAGIEREGQVRDHVTFSAPLGGVVVEKDAREGQYVETGMRLFTVADLSRVWVLLDAYESDLALLRNGQDIAFEAEAYPGESFQGTIAFIDPVVDSATRIVRVRVEVSNADGRLKPEMFVRAVVRAAVAEEGADAPRVIPATAPLVTGPRAVVYVAVPEREGVFAGRDVVLGPRAGDFYVVRAGLQEGEQVVVNGAFKIDSSLQIQGQPSMMAPAGGAAEMKGHVHE